MGTVNVTLGDGKKLNLVLGQQLENAVTAVVFDFSAWQTEFGSGTLGLSVQRHGDTQPYAVVPTVSGTNATWNISELDTAYKGVGEVQVTYTVGSVVKKSTVYKFTVYRSLGENGEYPSPGQSWQEEIEAELSDVKQDLGDLSELETEDKSNLVSAINEAAQSGGSGTRLTEDLKQALLQIAEKVAYIDEDGQDYYDALYDALYPPANLTRISCVYTQSDTVYDTDTLDSLKSDLVVTAHFDDSSTQTINAYTLSGTLTEGTSTITVAYGGKTATFNVTVTHIQTSEVLSTFTNDYNINSTTFENNPTSNDVVAEAGTLNASRVNFSWDTEECPVFLMYIAQYDSSGDPYKVSTLQRYSSSPITDGATFDTATGAWGDAGASWKMTAIGGGNITINLPTSGRFKVALRKGTNGTVVTSNATFKTWLADGGLTITAYI